ncbi:MAG: PAS domain-containing sensor histidine kinase [Sulfuricellaceae bacterium]|jgi:two-component system sensor histidine kinase PilS (NtrC family)
MRIGRLPAPDADTPRQLWRSLHYFNLYRLTVSGVFVVSFVLFGPTLTYGAENPRLFFLVSIYYVLFSTLVEVPLTLRWPAFEWQLSGHVLADVAFVTLLMFASGGSQSGLGLLLLISLAAAGLVGRGRLVLFFAAVSSLAVLLEYTYRVVVLDQETAGYLPVALLSVGFFTTAWLVHTLARRMRESEQVAREKSVDLENLAQVNQLVIRDMDDGVVVVDGKGKIRQHNAITEALLGRMLPFRNEMGLMDYSPALAECLARWRDQPHGGFEQFRAPATGKQLRARFVPVGGDPALGAVIFLEDLGRIQAMAQQFKLAALGRLTASIAHEIRNPLSAISYADELLLEEPDLEKSQRRLLEIIRDNTRRLEKMVQEVLQLNRRDRAQPEPIELADFIAAFVDEFCQIEKIPLERFALDVAPLPVVCFDRGHLNQVLWNLCRNAVRYCSGGEGAVRLAAKPAARKNYVVELSVSDDGPGVDEAVRPQLFEPFFTTASQGTGLGLYVAREICEANGAELTYGEGEQPGARFIVLFKGEPC